MIVQRLGMSCSSGRIGIATALPALALTACVTFGCASDNGGSTAGQGGSSATGGATGTGGGQGGQGGFNPGTGGGGGAAPSILYVHTNTTLFQGDPAVSPLSLSLLGDFDCIGGAGQSTSMTDVAVNADGELWAISTARIYRIDLSGGTVHCADTIPLNNPQGINFYGLTFAPKGVLDPDVEVLIGGNSGGELWSIDAGGNLALRGTFGIVPPDDGHGHAYANAGKTWELSGDIVFFANNGSPIGFATVRDCPNPPQTTGCNPVDTLIEIDVPKLATATTQSVTKSVRGQVLKAAGCTDASAGYGSVYGIAGYQGNVQGFSRQGGDGFAITISNVDGTACLDDTFPGLPWAGAGITTVAPVIEPPN